MSDAQEPNGQDKRSIESLGLALAAAVVERFVETGRRVAALRGAPADVRTDGSGARRGDRERQRRMRALREQADRLIDQLGESLHQLLDTADVVEELAESGRSDVLVVGPVHPGEAVTAEFWLHVLDGPATAPALLHATVLTAHDGKAIAPKYLSFEPAEIDLARLRAGHAVRLRVEAPPGTPAGIYHGHLLAAGLPETSLSIRVIVGPWEGS